MTSDGYAQARPGVERPITRADLEAKFAQLRGATSSGTEKARVAGAAAVVVGGVVLVLLAYVLGRRRGRKRRTIVEVRRV
jgi:alpha-D-ribose 1-methylphosphonate 5-triphosphate synthase subunit PhnL